MISIDIGSHTTVGTAGAILEGLSAISGPRASSVIHLKCPAESFTWSVWLSLFLTALNMGANFSAPTVHSRVFDTKLRNPINLQVAIRKQRVYRWRRHMLLGKAFAFRRITSLCKIWLSCLALSLCLLSAISSHLLANNGSLWYIAVTFPLDFVLMVVVLLVSRHLQMKSSVKLSHPHSSKTQLNTTESKKLRITVLGPFPKPGHLDMGSDSTVEHIIQQMRRRHLIADISRVKHHVIFPAHKFASLELNDTLQDPILQEKWEYLPCHSNSLMKLAIFPHHAQMSGSQQTRDSFAALSVKIMHRLKCGVYIVMRSPKVTYETWSAIIPQSRTMLLDQVQHLDLLQLGFEHRYVDKNKGVVNWDSDVMNFDTQLQETIDVRTTALLVEKLQQYLEDEGDINHNSDDDDEERSEAGSSESLETEPVEDAPYVAGRKSHKVDPNAIDSEWFPWPDKETCVLDILRHVPRSAFSKKQNAAIHWAMLALGLKDLPSDRVMDNIDKHLQKICGVQSRVEFSVISLTNRGSQNSFLRTSCPSSSLMAKSSAKPKAPKAPNAPKAPKKAPTKGKRKPVLTEKAAGFGREN
ncbi:hypothetical protein B0H10DRAFT_1954877 [Mycena sp. CBHHK59/15]|nr:hypothetical protein B0H10DRAFT_1954877 [Mycena sp. CBHHK59/15]